MYLSLALLHLEEVLSGLLGALEKIVLLLLFILISSRSSQVYQRGG